MKFATAGGLKALPSSEIAFPWYSIRSIQTRSGSARETSSMRRTGPRWFCLSWLMRSTLRWTRAFFAS